MSITLDTIESQASYGIGLELGQQLKNGGLKTILIPEAISKGIEDALNDKLPALEVSVIHNALRELQSKAAPLVQEEIAKQVGEQGRLFLEHNAKSEGVITTASGLQYKIIQQGTGASPESGSKVKVHYEGKNIAGQVFDSSIAKGTPIEFVIDGVVPGLKEALQLMPVGSRWHVFVPAELGYGNQEGGPMLPPNSTLIFDIELLEIL